MFFALNDSLMISGIFLFGVPESYLERKRIIKNDFLLLTVFELVKWKCRSVVPFKFFRSFMLLPWVFITKIFSVIFKVFLMLPTLGNGCFSSICIMKFVIWQHLIALDKIFSVLFWGAMSVGRNTGTLGDLGTHSWNSWILALVHPGSLFRWGFLTAPRQQLALLCWLPLLHVLIQTFTTIFRFSDLALVLHLPTHPSVPPPLSGR